MPPEQPGPQERQVSPLELLVAQPARHLAPRASPPRLAPPLPALE
jgi:hypothetical protein